MGGTCSCDNADDDDDEYVVVVKRVPVVVVQRPPCVPPLPGRDAPPSNYSAIADFATENKLSPSPLIEF
jgi:hypothetical protein